MVNEDILDATPEQSFTLQQEAFQQVQLAFASGNLSVQQKQEKLSNFSVRSNEFLCDVAYHVVMKDRALDAALASMLDQGRNMTDAIAEFHRRLIQ